MFEAQEKKLVDTRQKARYQVSLRSAAQLMHKKKGSEVASLKKDCQTLKINLGLSVMTALSTLEGANGNDTD